MSKTSVAALIFTSVLPAAALADSTTGEPEATVHDFATLSRASGQTGAGADVSFVTGDFGALDGAISRLDLHGEYVHASGFGAYGSFALSKAFLDGEGGDALEDVTARSNLELGVQYRRAVRDDLDLVAHAGLALPTAQGGDDLPAVVVNTLSVQRRLDDYVLAFGDLTALRLGVAANYRKGIWFARAEVGADIALDEPMGVELDPIIHGNVAVGAKLGKVSIAGELVTLATSGNVDEGEDRFLHQVAISASYDLGTVRPSLMVAMPLDDSMGRGDVWSVGGGIAASF
jgi:hypothetical protein